MEIEGLAAEGEQTEAGHGGGAGGASEAFGEDYFEEMVAEEDPKAH